MAPATPDSTNLMPTAAHPPGRRRRWRWTVAVLACVVVGVVIGVRWARAPLDRRFEVLLDEPLALIEDERAGGAIQPDHDGFCDVVLVFPEGPIGRAAWSALVAETSRTAGATTPMVTFEVRDGNRLVDHVSRNGDELRRPEDRVFGIGHFEGRESQRLNIEARVGRVQATIGGGTVRLKVRPAGDYVNFAGYEVALRMILVCLAAGVSLVAILLVWSRHSRRRLVGEDRAR